MINHKEYELTNHLGNVLTVVSDRKIGIDNDNDGKYDYYVADVISSQDYLPFGMIMPGRNYQANQYRFGFNGKMNDNEISGIVGEFQDYGMREYNALIGRFWSVDPLIAKYPQWTPYIFAGNNPIRFIDVYGMGPGDKFKTPNEAAIDFGKTYNDNSIAENKEYGSTIFKVVDDKGVTSYTYTIPNVSKEGVDVKPSVDNTKKSDRVAEVHTHGAYDKDFDHTLDKNGPNKGLDNNNEFSDDDEKRASSKRQPSYLVNPAGELRLFDPAENASGEYSIISKEMPSDPKSPNKVNDINTEKLPKDEPVHRKE